MFGLNDAGINGDTAAATPSQGPLVRTVDPLVAKALDELPDQLRAKRARLASLSALLGGDSTSSPSAVDITNLDYYLVLSGDQRLDSNERAEYFMQIDRAVERNTTGLTLIGPQRITLTGENERVTFFVESKAPATLQVQLRFSSDPRLDFPDGRATNLTVAPGVNNVSIRVRSRTPGATKLTLDITSPDQSILLANRQYQIRSIALSGVGWGLSIAALLVLLTWWVRHHRAAKTPRPTSEIRGAA